MKIKYRRNIILTLLSLALVTLLMWDFYIIKNRAEKKVSQVSSIVDKKPEHKLKIFNYSDILNTIESCSSKFVLVKIEKDTTNRDYINLEVNYKGEIGGLIKGVEIMKMQETTKAIKDINIGRTENNEYNAEINVDFLKFK